MGWRSVHASTWSDPPVAEEFERAAVPDLTVVLVTAGAYRIGSRQGGAWRTAAYRPGSVGVTAPGRPVRLRWRAESARPMESLHLRLPVGDTLRAYGSGELPDALVLDDGYVAAAAGALGRALHAAAPALYADSIAQALVTHLVHHSVPVRPAPAGPLDVGPVVDHMRVNLGADITLDELAAVAAMSKFHFARAFRAATGLPPYRYLTVLRMQRAAELLRGTGWSVQRVALACGYRSPSRFAAAFRREHGLPPARYRN
jgi:AraC family transcriptional regulator